MCGVIGQLPSSQSCLGESFLRSFASFKKSLFYVCVCVCVCVCFENSASASFTKRGSVPARVSTLFGGEYRNCMRCRTLVRCIAMQNRHLAGNVGVVQAQGKKGKTKKLGIWLLLELKFMNYRTGRMRVSAQRCRWDLCVRFRNFAEQRLHACHSSSLGDVMEI